MCVVEVPTGAEVLETVAAQAKEQGISDAAIVSLIGAVEGCVVSTMALDVPLKDLITEYVQPLELSGTGEIRNGSVHIYVLGSEGNQTISGHLHWVRVKTFFVRAYCIAL